MKIPGILFLVLVLSVGSASADYNFDGVPYTDKLEMVAHGTVNGSVYVDGGHGIGNARSPPYTQGFNVPDGNPVFSRLYVGVWGGTETKTGTLNTTFNDHEFDTLDLAGVHDTNPEVYCSGHGVYWVVYNTTDHARSGSNTADATISGLLDRVYGIILVAVYEDDSGEQVEYWINEGNPNLHGLGWSGDIPTANNKAHAYFPGVDPDSASAARLTVAYLCGSPYENDYLYFNDNKLNGDDVASSTGYFDLLTFDVTDFLEKSSNAKFDRGDEDYIHPVLAVLTVYSGEPEDEPSPSSCVSLGANIIPAVSIEVTPDVFNFGTLAPGQTSSEHTFGINNTGAYAVTVTADVTDTAGDLYVSGLLLDSGIWNDYATEITAGAAVDSVTALDVPAGYAGIGAKAGTLVFWAQKA